MNQLMLRVVEPKHKGSVVLTRALRIRISGNHTFLTLRDFDLEPFAAALLQIARVAALCDDAFELLFARGSEQCLPIRKRIRNSEAIIGAEHLLQILLAYIEVHAG